MNATLSLLPACIRKETDSYRPRLLECEEKIAVIGDPLRSGLNQAVPRQAQNT